MLHAMRYLRPWRFFLGSSAWILNRHLLPCNLLHVHLASIPGSNYWLFVPAVKASIHLPTPNMSRKSVLFVIYPFFYRITWGREIAVQSWLPWSNTCIFLCWNKSCRFSRLLASRRYWMNGIPSHVTRENTAIYLMEGCVGSSSGHQTVPSSFLIALMRVMDLIMSFGSASTWVWTSTCHTLLTCFLWPQKPWPRFSYIHSNIAPSHSLCPISFSICNLPPEFQWVMLHYPLHTG